MVLAEKMANAALVAMRDTKRAIAAKLSALDGAEAVGKNEKMHENTLGCHVMNDHVESNFGSYDTVARCFRYASVANVSGITQQMRNQDFARPDLVAHDRQHFLSSSHL